MRNQTARRAIWNSLEPRVCLSSGDLDPTFGNSGRVVTPSAVPALPMANDPSGNVICIDAVGGGGYGNSNSIRVSRYLKNGGLDTRFGGDGAVELAAATFATSYGMIALQDGSMLVEVGTTNARIYKLKFDGTLDTSFASAGVLSPDFGPVGFAFGLTPASNGKFLVDTQIGVARFNADGSPDLSFGSGGHVSLFAMGSGSAVTRMANLADGSVVVYCVETNPQTQQYQARVRHLTANGTQDLSFGNNGIVEVGGLLESPSFIYQAELLADGTDFYFYSPPQGVSQSTNSVGEGILTHLKGNGSIDLSYGSGGSFTFMPDSVGVPLQHYLTQLPDGRVALYGSQVESNTMAASIILVTPLGHADTSFSTDGFASVLFPAGTPLVGGGTAPYGVIANVWASLFQDGASRLIISNLGMSSWNTDDQYVTSAAFQLGAYAPAGTIVGAVWEDLDANGQWNHGYESPIGGRTVYLDANNNGQLDAGETQTQSDLGGRYAFANLPDDTYHVRQVLPANWELTQPGSTLVVTLSAADRVYVGALLGSRPNGTTPPVTKISGTVFKDFNYSTTRDDTGTGLEPGIAGRTVWLDINNNKRIDIGEPSTLTDAQGAWSFSDIPAILYSVRLAPIDDWYQSTPINDAALSVQAIQNNEVSGLTFGTMTAPGTDPDPDPTKGTESISGTVWLDTNYSTVRDANEAGLSGRNIYVDTNRNKRRDAGELFVTTDADGHYVFLDLGPGTYTLRQELPEGCYQSFPHNDAANTIAIIAAEQEIAGADFGTQQIPGFFLTGAGVGTLKAQGAALARVKIFADLDGDNLIDANEPQTVTNSKGRFFFDQPIKSAAVLKVSAQHSLAPTTKARVRFSSDGSATVYVDRNRNKRLDSSDRVLKRATLFDDVNGNGVLDLGEFSFHTTRTGRVRFESLPMAVNIGRLRAL